MAMRLNICIIKTGQNYHSATFSEKQEDIILIKTGSLIMTFPMSHQIWVLFSGYETVV